MDEQKFLEGLVRWWQAEGQWVDQGRWCQGIFDVMLHRRLLLDAGVKIVTCQRGELDFNNWSGVITAIVDQYGAREESIKLADRVVSGKKMAIRQGQKQGGALFG